MTEKWQKVKSKPKKNINQQDEYFNTLNVTNRPNIFSEAENYLNQFHETQNTPIEKSKNKEPPKLKQSKFDSGKRNEKKHKGLLNNKDEISSNDAKHIKQTIKNLNPDELKEQINTAHSYYGNRPTEILWDSIVFLNSKFASLKDNEFATRKFDSDPLCFVPSDVVAQLKIIIEQCDSGISQIYIKAIQEYLIRADSDKSAIGYRIIIQLISKVSGHHLIEKSKTLMEMVRNGLSRNINNVWIVIWSITQIAHGRAHYAFDMWVKALFPLINHKQLCLPISESLGYIVNMYIESPTKISGNQLFVADDFFNFVQTACISPPKNGVNVLRDVLPAVQSIAHESLDDQAEIFFNGYLLRLSYNPTCPIYFQSMRDGALLALLHNPKACFKNWEKFADAYPRQSCILLKYLRENLEKYKMQLNKENSLSHFLNTFEANNEDLSAEIHIFKTELETVDKRNNNFIMMPLILLALLFAGDVLYHDRYSSTYTNHALVHIQSNSYYLAVQGWCSKNVPYYYKQLVEVSQPLLSSVSSNLISLTELMRSHFPNLTYLLFEDFPKKTAKFIQSDVMPQVDYVKNNYFDVWLGNVINIFQNISFSRISTTSIDAFQSARSYFINLFDSSA